MTSRNGSEILEGVSQDSLNAWVITRLIEYSQAHRLLDRDVPWYKSGRVLALPERIKMLKEKYHKEK